MSELVRDAQRAATTPLDIVGLEWLQSGEDWLDGVLPVLERVFESLSPGAIQQCYDSHECHPSLHVTIAPLPTCNDLSAPGRRFIRRASRKAHQDCSLSCGACFAQRSDAEARS